ncbi:MAG TPA: T9SS type A sorting domain-containing protein, partial [Flavobacteriales bacterium]|nr:T9SS type A sorting domain-containing protein [Flavobacteriales bacterium]
SDSIRPEQELEGGSLIEAAIDDIEVWSMVGPDAVVEYANERALAVWPSPTQGPLNIEVRIPNEPGMQVEVLDLTGRTVVAPRVVRQDVIRLDVSNLADGQYVVRLRSSQGWAERRFSVLH